MKNTDLFVTRREMLSRCGMGMGAVALAPLLAASTNAAINPLAPKQPPLPAKAKRVLHLFRRSAAQARRSHRHFNLRSSARAASKSARFFRMSAGASTIYASCARCIRISRTTNRL
jgi:hypothetical protein